MEVTTYTTLQDCSSTSQNCSKYNFLVYSAHVNPWGAGGGEGGRGKVEMYSQEAGHTCPFDFLSVSRIVTSCMFTLPPEQT